MCTLTLTDLMSCCPNLECVNMRDEGLPAPFQSDNGEPLFHVVVTNKNSGRKTVVSNPLTERQAYVLRSKMADCDWRTVTVEPLAP